MVQRKIASFYLAGVWPVIGGQNLEPLEDEPPIKALFFGTLAASQASPITQFITADNYTEILDNKNPLRWRQLSL